MSKRSTFTEPIAGELVVRNGPDEGVVRTLLVPVTLIGTHESCDLRILDETVRAVHCVLAVTPEGPHLRSVGGYTPVNGIPASSRLLQSGDILTIGPVDLEVCWHLPPGPTPNSTASVIRPKLISFVPERHEPTRREAG
jgi:pSer/pThr/pTyr-binding forkhead associated (FHA) protein